MRELLKKQVPVSTIIMILGMTIAAVIMIGQDGCQINGQDGDWLIAGDDMSSLPSGNVGIGTGTPEAKLDVNGEIRINGPITRAECPDGMTESQNETTLCIDDTWRRKTNTCGSGYKACILEGKFLCPSGTGNAFNRLNPPLAGEFYALDGDVGVCNGGYHCATINPNGNPVTQNGSCQTDDVPFSFICCSYQSQL